MKRLNLFEGTIALSLLLLVATPFIAASLINDLCASILWAVMLMPGLGLLKELLVSGWYISLGKAR